MKESASTSLVRMNATAAGAAKLTMGLASVLMLAYATVRAWSIAFTYDECYTFIEHVSRDMFYQSSFDKMGGNHHLLNVWGMWFSRALFGDGELALRLPNLFAYVAYLYASARIALQARTALLALACFVLLNAHPYVIDFFSLARGYGLANGFMMLSLWHSWKWLMRGFIKRDLLFASVFAALAPLCHVIMINYLLAFGASAVLFIIVNRRREGVASWRAELLTLFAVGVAGLLVMLPNAIGLFNGGSLNFGCDEIWPCTARTVAENALYHQHYPRQPLTLIENALWWSAGTCAAITALTLWKRRPELLRPLAFGFSVFTFCLFSLWAQHALFAVPYPQARTGLFFMPLVAFIVVAALIGWSAGRWLPALIAIAGCAPLLSVLTDAWNIDHAVEWKTTGGLRKALETIATDRLPGNSDRPLTTVRVGMEVSGSMGYYARSRNWHWLAHERWDAVQGEALAEYHVTIFDEQHLVDSSHWTPLFRSPTTGLALYRDERARIVRDSVVHHAVFTGADHASDHFPKLEWTLPDSSAPMPVRLVGSIRAREQNSSNWIGLIMEVHRAGQPVYSSSLGSHEQVERYGAWGTVSVQLDPAEPLLPGDKVVFLALPCFRDPLIDLGPADLWIMH